MKKSRILLNLATWAAERDGLPINLREDQIESMLYAAEKVYGIDPSKAFIRMIHPQNG